MKILFLCHRLPFTPDRGGAIRPFHIAAHLSRAHTVTVATLQRDEAGARPEWLGDLASCIVEPVGQVRSWWHAAAALPTATPSSFAYFRSGALAKRVRVELARDYDLVFVHCSSMAPYVGHTRAATLLDFGDMDSRKWLAYSRRRSPPLAQLYRLEAWKVARAEREAARRFDLSTVATREELATLQSYGVPRPSGWFPNGVDVDYFQPDPTGYERDTICFLGRMDYFPNRDAVLWFCDEVLPLVRARRPRVQLTIIGGRPPAAIRRLAERPGIQVTGSVADVRPCANRAALSVAPLRIARGTQNKVLESLAMGVPVVASSRAARGTLTTPDEHLLTADDAPAFSAAVLRLLENPAERQRLADAGRRQMVAVHTWPAAMRCLDALIEQCVAQRPARGYAQRPGPPHPGVN